MKKCSHTERRYQIKQQEHNLSNTHLQKYRQVGIIASKDKFGIVMN